MSTLLRSWMKFKAVELTEDPRPDDVVVHVRLFDLRSRSHAVVLDLGGVGATAVDFRPRRREIFAVGARAGKG